MNEAKAQRVIFLVIYPYPLKYTDPDGKWQVYSRVDNKTGKTNYFMGTPQASTVAMRWISNWLPGGSYLANMQNGLSNLYNRAAANNFLIEYDTDESGFDGVATAADLISFIPAAGTANSVIKALTTALSGSGTVKSLFSSKDDKKVQKFLNSLTFAVLGGVEDKNEAIAVAGAIAVGALVYDKKGLEKKDIDQNDWAKAVKDQVYGRNSQLYNDVMAGKYD
jgi:hypothetical protein